MIFFLALTIYYTSKTTPERFAELTIVLISIQWLNAVSRFSLDSYIIKYVVEYGERFLSSVFLLRIMLQLFVSIFTFVFLHLYNFQFLNRESILILIINLFRIHDVFENYFKAKNKFNYIFFTRIISYVVIIGTIIVVEIPLELFFVLDAIPIFIGLSLLRYRNTTEIYRNVSFKEFFIARKEDLLHSGYLTISLFTYMLLAKVDWISLNMFSSKFDIGVYSFFIRLVEPITAITGVLAVALYPSLVELRQKNYKKYEILLESYQRKFTALGLLLVLIAIISIELLDGLKILSEFEYVNFVWLLRILVLNVFFFFISALRTYYLILESNPSELFKISLASIIVIFPISFLLGIEYGMKGVAWSSVIGNLCYQFLFNRLRRGTKSYFNIQLKGLKIWKKVQN